jgi:hypothetical protein
MSNFIAIIPFLLGDRVFDGREHAIWISRDWRKEKGSEDGLAGWLRRSNLTEGVEVHYQPAAPDRKDLTNPSDRRTELNGFQLNSDMTSIPKLELSIQSSKSIGPYLSSSYPLV